MPVKRWDFTTIDTVQGEKHAMCPAPSGHWVEYDAGIIRDALRWRTMQAERRRQDRGRGKLAGCGWPTAREIDALIKAKKCGK